MFSVNKYYCNYTTEGVNFCGRLNTLSAISLPRITVLVRNSDPAAAARLAPLIRSVLESKEEPFASLMREEGLAFLKLRQALNQADRGEYDVALSALTEALAVIFVIVNTMKDVGHAEARIISMIRLLTQA